MKSDIEKKSSEGTGYPIILKSDHLRVVVLFSEPCRGVVLHSGGGYVVGRYSEDWPMGTFQPFKDVVKLRN